jgi:hypothetical protein
MVPTKANIESITIMIIAMVMDSNSFSKCLFSLKWSSFRYLNKIHINLSMITDDGLDKTIQFHNIHTIHFSKYCTVLLKSLKIKSFKSECPSIIRRFYELKKVK